MSNRHKALKKTESNPPLRGARGVFSLKIRFPLPEDTPLRPPQGGIFSGLLILLLLLCFHVPANAYIMEGQAVLKQMLQKLGTANTLLVSQEIVFFTGMGQDNRFVLDETLRYVFPDVFRSDILTENIQRVHLLSPDGVLTVTDGKAETGAETRFDAYKDILLYRSQKMLEEKLPLLGIDISLVSLGRFQGKKAYVLGAEYPDKSASQIWIEKDTFTLLRLVIAGKSAHKKGKKPLEIRYADWCQTGGILYPMRIEFYQKDEMVREVHVRNIEVNPHFPDALFDMKGLGSDRIGGDAAVSGLPKTDGASDEVQKIIDDFRKIYEE